MKFDCNIARELTADVAVVGAGTAGVFAAIAAARTGADVVLIEKNSMPGGTVTTAGVNYPGLFFAWGRQIIDGPCWEAIRRTEQLGGCRIPEITFHPEHHWQEQIRLNPFVYTSVLYEMCAESGVRILANTMISHAQDGEQGVRLILTDKSGLMRLNAGAAIDATGDANLAALCGFELQKSAEQQPATLHNRLSGYQIESIDPAAIASALKGAGLPDYITAERLVNFLEIQKIDLHIPCRDADTSAGKTALERDALALLMKLYRLYRSTPGLENLQIDLIAAETGVRESCRILGESVVTAEDYISGRAYADAVCYAFYPIDLHVENGIRQKFHTENTVSEIPYGALIPKGARRVLCAGRCISSDTYANSALRVQAPCMATGQAAGCAAALCVRDAKPVDGLQAAELTAALKKIGAIVPRA